MLPQGHPDPQGTPSCREPTRRARYGITTKRRSTDLECILRDRRDLYDRLMVRASLLHHSLPRYRQLTNHSLTHDPCLLVSFAENAESECENAVKQAIESDTTNPEAFQVAASLRISQQRNADALEFLTQSHNLWKELGTPSKQSINQSINRPVSGR